VRLVLIVAAVVAPLVAGTNLDLLNDMVLAGAYVVMALGLNLVVGFAGLLDLGYVAFYVIGAYTAAYLASGYWANAGTAQLPGIHLNFLLVFVVAVAATTVVGALIGVPTLRLRGDYIAIVTIAFGEIVGTVALNGHEIGVFGGTLTGGPIGIGPIDKIDLPFLSPFDDVHLRPWYWFALGLVVMALVVNARLRDSRVGRAWIALRDDEAAAATSGVPLWRTKLLAYAVGASFGGVSGAFLASYISIVNARQFEFSFSIFLLSMIVIGGLGSIGGVVVGAIALSAVDSYLLPDVLHSLPQRIGLDFDLSAISSGLYGAVIVIVIVLRPQPAPLTK
jgi:branched-chain amino acid transport system permease protein